MFNPLESAKDLGKFLNTDLNVPKDIKVYNAEPGSKYFNLKEHNLTAKKVKTMYYDGEILEVAKQEDTFLIPFAGLNSKLFYIELGDIENKKTLQEIGKEIKENMDKKEADLVLKAKKEFKNKQLVFVRRKISLEIAKLMEVIDTTAQKEIVRAIIVNPTPIEKEGVKNGKVYLGVFGYESLIVATIE